jgi:hypothetical protein
LAEIVPLRVVVIVPRRIAAVPDPVRRRPKRLLINDVGWVARSSSSPWMPVCLLRPRRPVAACWDVRVSWLLAGLRERFSTITLIQADDGYARRRALVLNAAEHGLRRTAHSVPE